ncbi:Beta-1-3-galactosyltransferase 1-like 5 [Homarus americanus]|uniref:Hexosyltransferase n=1 Tax=Homarus americanus TaxID=6706 RepID=A0A8J5MSH8_HOMAM|nr:Beta-1-3-galactosyltransferase 1-like 5 [Homarus americanus]
MIVLVALCRREYAVRPPIPDNPRDSPVCRPANIPNKFLIEEEDFCQRGQPLQVVSFVHSSISRVKKRMETRKTWANASAYGLGTHNGVVFMVGRAKNPHEEMIVQNESLLYHDIVQGDYGDHYQLLSYKALAAMNWITRHCSHVPWTLHADDDLIIDSFLLQEFIQTLNSESKKQIICRRMVGRVLRKGKWKVTREEYSAKMYPKYCQGTMWLLATEQLPKLLEASKEVSYLWVDDAFITGLLVQKAHIGLKDIGSKFTRIFKRSDIGKKIAWWHLPNVNSTAIWRQIVHYHKQRYKPNPSQPNSIQPNLT